MRDTSVSWQKKLAQGFVSVSELLKYLELPSSLGDNSAEKEFATRIPLGFAQRMRKRDPLDPLLLQVLASQHELLHSERYSRDPLKEQNNNPVKGIIHKYPGRVLLAITGACAINCRYCFRRHFPYQENNPGRSGFKEICDYIAQDTSIHEVILSGGDPLLASNKMIGELIKQLEAISHLHTLRIHTRIPVVFPERIEPSLLALLSATRFKKVVVLHCNHPQELDDTIVFALEGLHHSGCHLLNQSVLLSGINDKAEILASLNEKLFNFGVLPYYLHVLDKVKGAAHFDLPLNKAQTIYRKLQLLVPGYLVPRLVREEPGKLSKTLLI